MENNRSIKLIGDGEIGP